MNAFSHARKSLVYGLVMLALAASWSVPAADVAFYGVIKKQSFRQDNPDVVVLDDHEGIVFQAFVDLNVQNSVTSVTLAAPLGTNATLQAEESGYNFSLEKSFGSLLALNTNFANGTYTLTIQANSDGTKVVSLNLAGDTYPNPPRLTAASYNAAQAHNAGSGLTLNWESLGGTVSDFVQLSIEDLEFESPGPGEPGALNGTSTSYTIPAGTLQAGRRYEVQLFIAKFVDQSTAYGSGVTGVAAYLKETHFHILTTGGTDNTAPFLQASIPYYGHPSVPTNSSVAFIFSEKMQTASPGASIQWSGSGINPANFVYTWSSDATILYATYTGGLPLSTTITWTLNPVGSQNLRDVAGNLLPLATRIFTTSSDTTPLPNDVKKITITKGQEFYQSAATPVATGNHAFDITGDLTGLNTVTGGYLQLPAGGKVYPEGDFNGDVFDLNANYASKTDLDTYFPSGNYSASIQTTRNGTQTINFTVPADNYPNDPTVSNLGALQALNHAATVTINWNTFTSGGADDIIRVKIENEHAMEIYETAGPGEANALTGTATSTDIPANTLSPGRKYRVSLGFGRRAVFDNTSYAGVPLRFYFGKSTEFYIQTTGTPVPATLSIPNSAAVAQIDLTGDKNWLYSLEASLDLKFWAPVTTIGTGTAGFIGFYDSDAQYVTYRFYRVREPAPGELLRRFVALQGTVRNANNSSPIAGAVVSTTLDNRTAVTDANGKFFLQTQTQSNFSTSNYGVTVTKSGFNQFSQNSNWGDQPRNLSINLNPQVP